MKTGSTIQNICRTTIFSFVPLCFIRFSVCVY